MHVQSRQNSDFMGPALPTYDPSVVVVGQHALAQRHQQPEGFFLGAVEQQDRGDDVHGLEETRTHNETEQVTGL